MPRALSIGARALLLAIFLSSLSSTSAAQTTGPAAAAARERLRAKVVAAASQGTISRAQRSAILREAKTLLAPAELQALRASLNQITPPAKRAAPKPAQKPIRVYETDKQGPNRATRTSALLSAGDNRGAAALYDQPVEFQNPGNPFQEEKLEPIPAPTPIEAPLDGLQGGYPLTAVPDGCEDGAVPMEGSSAARLGDLTALSLFSTVDAFKGPMDLDNQNGNFGFRFGLNGAVAIVPQFGLGVQGGISGTIADFHGTRLTGSHSRSQDFITIGIFDRLPVRQRRLVYGFAYDWLNDDYSATLRMGQWRVKLAFELNPCNEIGLWAAIPDHGDSVVLRGLDRLTFESFRPIPQGNLYYRHCWEMGATTAAWIGIAEEPGEFVFGADGRIPISGRMAVIGNFNYILPSASGPAGQSEEFWSVSLGIEITPGCGRNCCQMGRFGPLLPLADNGSFAVRRRSQPLVDLVE